MLAIRILRKSSEEVVQCRRNSLLRVVCRICENSGIKSMLDTIRTLYDNPVCPGFYEFVIKENLPLFMKKLSEAMGHERFARRSTASGLCASKFLEAAGKLLRYQTDWI